MTPTLQGYIGPTDPNTDQLKRLILRRTHINQQRPAPPRGVKVSGGALVWEVPRDTTGVTHYNIYADSETHLVRQVPAGQLILTDPVSASIFFVTSFNQMTGLESTVAMCRAFSGGTGSTVLSGVPLPVDLAGFGGSVGASFDRGDGKLISPINLTFTVPTDASVAGTFFNLVWDDATVPVQITNVPLDRLKTGTYKLEIDTPNTSKGFTVYALTYNSQGATNPLQIGTTPSVHLFAGAGGGGTINLSNSVLSSVAAYFSTATGIFKVNPLGITNDLVNQIAISKLTAAFDGVKIGTAIIANAAITNALIANAAILDANIATATITAAKIASLNASSITVGGTITGNNVVLNNNNATTTLGNVVLGSLTFGIKVLNNSTSQYAAVSQYGMYVIDGSGNTVASMSNITGTMKIAALNSAGTSLGSIEPGKMSINSGANSIVLDASGGSSVNGNGFVSGSFTTVDGKTVTVTAGFVTSIV